MLRVSLLAAALLSLAPAAAAQDGRWTAVCSETPEVVDATPYVLTSDASGCLWTHDDGSTVEIDAALIAETLAEVEAVTDWLAETGFRDPLHFSDRGRWPLVFSPGGSVCYRGECLALPEYGAILPYADAEGDYRGVLAVTPEAITSGEKRYARSLMLLTQIAYGGFMPGDWCAPDCAVSFGMAEGFRRWWLGRSGPFPPTPARFGEPLTTSTALSDRMAGQETSAFWTFVGFPVTSYQGGFAYAREVYEAIEQETRAGGHALDAADRVIAKEAYGPNTNAASGIANDFASFVNYQYRRGPLAPPEEALTVAAGEAEARAVVHAPLAAVVLPVRIPAVRELAAVTVRVRGASPAIAYSIGNAEGVALNVHRLDASGEHEWHFNTARVCPEGGECEFQVALSNAHPERASRTTDALYTVEVEVSDVCALPAGARGITYAVAGASGEIARVGFDVPRASRRRGASANVITGTATVAAVGVETDFEGTLECGEQHLRLADLRFGNAMLDGVLAEPLAAAVQGPRLSLPANPRVGDTLPDVITNAAIGRESDEDVVTASGVLQGLRITGRERRRIDGVSGSVEVWAVEGVSTTRMATDGAAMTDMAGDAGATVDGEVEASTQEAIREAGFDANSDLRQTLGGLFGRLSSDGDTSTPVTIYYSPLYGAVETVTGTGEEAVRARLVEVRGE